MSELIVYLSPPALGPTADYRYVQTRDGQSVDDQGSRPVATLPSAGLASDVVALVPAQALSWHQVDLPKGALGAGPARLRAVLEGLLEDRLLDDTPNLHLAISPHAQAGTSVWVAACDKAWLRAALAPLEAAGRPVSRIVPECVPDESSEGAAPTLYAVGDPEQGQWLVVSRAGVVSLPLASSSHTSLQAWLAAMDDVHVLAEPAVVARAEQLLGRQPRVQQAAERWVQATQNAWDLAQFDLANSGRQRAFKKLGDQWRHLLYAPPWRAARWGCVCLVLAHVVGLNAWAWKEKSELGARRLEIREVLSQTFPQVKLIIDAPVQMGRELVQLRQAAGAPSGQDLEQMFSAIGAALPPAQQAGLVDIKSLDYAEGELRIKGLSTEIRATLESRLGAQAYRTRTEGDALILQPAARP